MRLVTKIQSVNGVTWAQVIWYTISFHLHLHDLSRLVHRTLTDETTFVILTFPCPEIGSPFATEHFRVSPNVSFYYALHAWCCLNAISSSIPMASWNGSSIWSFISGSKRLWLITTPAGCIMLSSQTSNLGLSKTKIELCSFLSLSDCRLAESIGSPAEWAASATHNLL